MFRQGRNPSWRPEVALCHGFAGKTNGGIPEMGRLSDLPRVPPDCAVQWERRQPHGEYHISRRLRAWYKEIAKFFEKEELPGKGRVY